tara:strand:+ start:199 stop:537 length:339 start_codon:yes stop_codon:yes gene_type:complete
MGKNPNEKIHFEWVKSSTRADNHYDYCKLSMEELDIAEDYIVELLNNYEEGNERKDVAEMICIFASMFSSSSPHEQQGILVSALNKSKDVHEELFKNEKTKLKYINDLLNKK